MLTIFSDDYYMDMAIKEARKALSKGEIPVGAVLVADNKIIAKSHNHTQILNDVTAHAEILAITSASEHFQAKYLNEATLYVTLEPCPMCAGALKWAQLGKLVYGAEDPKNGFMQFGKAMLHPRTKVAFGIKNEVCSKMMSDFFLSRRK